MDQLQQQVVQLVQAAMQGNQQATQQIQQIAKAAQAGDQQAVQIYQLIQQVAQQMTQKAQKGAKLNYIKSLRNVCGENEELVYMKKGGKVCPVCQKKKVEKECGGGAVKLFKAKCGGKSKLQVGGQVPPRKQPTIMGKDGKTRPLTEQQVDSLKKKQADLGKKIGKQGMSADDYKRKKK